MTQPPDTTPLHVLELGTWLTTGGISRHIVVLRDWLRAHGQRVSIAGDPGEWINAANEADFLDLPLISVGWRGGALPRRALASLRAALVLRRWLKANRVDVMHAHDSTPALVAWLARLGLNIPLVITYHGSEPERIAGFGRTARRADMTVTPSRMSARDLATIGGVPESRLRVIGLGVDPVAPPDPAAAAALRARLLGPTGDRVILTLARLVPQKGIDILIEVAARVKAAHPGWRFVVAGDGADDAALRARAKDRGVADTVLFVGRTAEPHLYLTAADLFLLTSRWEALPFTIVEAYRMGRPAVATACSGVVELIDDETGRVAPIGDVPAIAAALEEVLGDEGLRQRLAAAALARSREDRFDPDWVHPKFLELYRELAGRR